MRAVFQSAITPSRRWSSSGRVVRAWWTRVRWAGRWSASTISMPSSRVRTSSCRARTPAGRSTSIRGAAPERSVMSCRAGSGITGGQPRGAGPRRPRRRVPGGEQVAEPLGAGDPGGVHERGQPDELGGVGQPGGTQPGGVQPGQPGLPASDRISGVVMFRRPGSVPPQTSPVPADAAAASSRPW